MGLWSAIKETASALWDTACSVARTLGGAIGRGVEILGRTLGPVAERIAGWIGLAASVVDAVATALGIFRPDEDTRQMGDRAIQAAEKGIRADDFDDFDAYLEALRGFELNPAHSRASSDEAKLLAGMSLAGWGLERRFELPDGHGVVLWPVAIAAADYLTPERTRRLLEAGLDPRDLADYLAGRLGLQRERTVEEVLLSLDRKLDPGRDEAARHEALDTARAKVRETLEA